METILIPGTNLSPEQITHLPFNGAKNPDWIKAHSFWFNADGKSLSTKSNEYYPVCHSLAFLPY